MLPLIWIFLTANILCVSGTSLVHVPCDDKTVEKLSRLAVTYINEDRQTGYKFALNRITNVQAHQQGPAGKVYYLDLDVLETKCHVLSPKSWKKCTIRPFMETSSPFPASFVEYTVQECSVASFPEVLCEPGQEGKEPVGFCVGEVLGHGQQDVKVSCEIFRPQVHVVNPTQQGDKFSKSPIHNAHIPHIHKPSFQDVKPVTPQLADPVFQAIPAGPDSTVPTSSSESTESSESVSSEEAGGSVRAVKPPLNFRYVPRRQRRQIPTSTAPPHSPVFLSVFPSAPSPFRSCPGVSRYTTV
ncbi:fetuin-B-like protein [Labeo rohita]|uniref:Fetuin-B-like protein n=1 Tax=Labeo rohita TaxID=84645 RepID=A0A498M2B3_LABRO|nr:fetuin-B-like protein [Labeo rohita]